METLLGVVVAGLGAGAVYLVKKLGAKLFLKQFGPTVKTVFDVLDPIAGKILTEYDGSVVQEAVELAVLRVGDGTIDEADVSAVAKYVISKFDPSLAASKVIEAASEEAKACAELATAIGQLADGVDKHELRNLMSLAPKLI